MAYGLKLVKAQEPREIREIIVTSGVTITKGDTVNITDGQVTFAGEAEFIDGVALATVVGDGVLKAPIHIAKEGDVWEADNDNDTNTFGDSGYGAGKTYDLTGTTGTLQVDTSSASTSGDKQLYCVNQAPKASDKSIGWYVISERPTTNVAV